MCVYAYTYLNGCADVADCGLGRQGQLHTDQFVLKSHQYLGGLFYVAQHNVEGRLSSSSRHRESLVGFDNFFLIRCRRELTLPVVSYRSKCSNFVFPTTQSLLAQW